MSRERLALDQGEGEEPGDEAPETPPDEPAPTPVREPPAEPNRPPYVVARDPE